VVLGLEDWKKEYKNKTKSKEEVIRHIKSDDRVVLAHAAGEPTILVDEIVRQKDRFENVEIVHMVPIGEAEYCQAGMEKHFRHNSLFAGAKTRKSIKEGR